MSRYTRAAYIEIGKVVRNTPMSEGARRALCKGLCDTFRRDNPQFDERTFRLLVNCVIDDDLPQRKGVAKATSDVTSNKG